MQPVRLLCVHLLRLAQLVEDGPANLLRVGIFGNGRRMTGWKRRCSLEAVRPYANVRCRPWLSDTDHAHSLAQLTVDPSPEHRRQWIVSPTVLVVVHGRSTRSHQNNGV